MTNRTLWLRTAATLTIAISLVASGCSNGAGNNANANNSAGNQAATANSSASPEASPTDEAADSSASPSPSPSAEPTTSPSPTNEATTQPSAAATADPAKKPSSKPTAKPAEKPAATAKPAEKPAATSKPAAKPTIKPTAKPTIKPTDKPSPTPKPEAPGANISVTDIIDNITSDIELPPLIEVSGEQVKDYYYFDGTELLADGIFKQALMNTKATELVVVKLKSADNYDAVKKGLTKRAEDIIKIFSTYLPDQYEDAQNYQILRNGNYVLLSISHDQDAIKKAFEASFK